MHFIQHTAVAKIKYGDSFLNKQSLKEAIWNPVL